MRADLIPVMKDLISKRGEAYQRKYWTRSPDEQRHDAAVGTALVSGWIHSSSSEAAAKMMGAAAKLYGLGEKAIERDAASLKVSGDKYSKDMPPSWGRGSEETLRQGYGDDRLVRVVQDLATAAQDKYSDEFVTVYRGVKGRYKLGEDARAGDEINVKLRTLASFTEDRGIAERFAASKGGAVIALRVPRSSIVDSFRSDRLLMRRKEKEVIVASAGAALAKIVRFSDSYEEKHPAAEADED